MFDEKIIGTIFKCSAKTFHKCYCVPSHKNEIHYKYKS